MQTYPTGYAQSHRMAEHIFRDILPRRGMAVREEQIALCHEILDTLYNKEISLCEAGVGIGKTLAYLVACVLWQTNRPDRLKLPVVISTSSVVLQDAIINDYLPNLSAILLEEGIIQAPLTAVIRKGKERFVCDARLIERESQIPTTRNRQRNSLRMAEQLLDMDHLPELSRFDRSRICVPQSCPRNCVLQEDCRYQQYLRDSMKPDIQICNHNYLLADAAHRQQDRPLLLRSYQALVVDEAHKLPDAARQMYTESLSEREMQELCTLLRQAHYSHIAQNLRTAFRTLVLACQHSRTWKEKTVCSPFGLTPFRSKAWRNGGRVIQQFKESGNGILFAAGSCWEGIDFPGDMVSLLIIAKLPFPIPDPVSDYERRQYPNLRDYINAEIIPEMQKKLRQGFGRAIRTEQDSCVVAILDERAGIGGRYHDAALAALPICPTTEKIEDVQQFIREQKRPDYFL